MTITFDSWRTGGRLFAHAGHPIFYRVDGEGPALLAIHGFPSASWDWHRMWPALTARFRVIASDMIGFGWSAKPARHHYSIDDQATLHETLLEELGVTSVHVLAHDYGDTVAQELLARDADRRARGEPGVRLASVCFLNGGLFPEAHHPRAIQRVLASPVGAVVGRLSSKRLFARNMTAIFGAATPPSRVLIDELWTLLRHADGHHVLHRVIGYMAERQARRDRWVGILRRTSVPLRVIDGTADPVSGAGMVARYRELVPSPDTVELPTIGHYPQLEAPDAVVAAFLAFQGTLSHSARSSDNAPKPSS
jgi:pimeloyl-ACP methyl ester carboxylesterase